MVLLMESRPLLTPLSGMGGGLYVIDYLMAIMVNLGIIKLLSHLSVEGAMAAMSW